MKKIKFIFLIIITVFVFTTCVQDGGELTITEGIFPTGLTFEIPGTSWPGMDPNIGVSGEFFLIEDNGLLAMGNPEPRGTAPSRWTIYYAGSQNLVFAPGTKQKVAIRNIQTGNFLSRKGVSRAEKGAAEAVQLKMLPFEETDEFFWWITKEVTYDSVNNVYEYVNITNYGFEPGTGGALSWAHSGAVKPNAISGKSEVHFIHFDSDSAWDQWNAVNVLDPQNAIINGMLFNLTIVN